MLSSNLLFMGVSGDRHLCLVVFFFFSSRRRHTRCLSDWSSDVCSSDLGLAAVALRPMKERKMVKRDLETGGGEHLYNELLTAGSDGTPRLYKMHRETKRVIGDDANKIREFEKMPGRIYTLSFSADGMQFAAGSSNDGTGEARVYQTADGKKLATLEGQKGAVYAVKFRPDGKAVASAGFDGTIRLNDPATGKLNKEFVPVPLTTKVAGK